MSAGPDRAGRWSYDTPHAGRRAVLVAMEPLPDDPRYAERERPCVLLPGHKWAVIVGFLAAGEWEWLEDLGPEDERTMHRAMSTGADVERQTSERRI